MESAIYLACHVIELRLRPTSLLEQQVIGVSKEPAKFELVPFEVPNKARDDEDSRFVLKVQTRPALWVRFAIATNGLDVLRSADWMNSLSPRSSR